MKPNRLAFATLATLSLGGPVLASAQTMPGEGEDGAIGVPLPEEQPPPEPPPAPAPAEHGAGLKYDGGFALESDDGQFELKIGLRSQFRFDVLRNDIDADAAEFNARFAVNRLRLQLEGHAYGKTTTYKFEFDMANRGFAVLKDGFIDHALSPTLHLRAGQWKKPFNRQEIVSDFGSEMVERSLTNEFAGAGRDLGVALHNDYEKSPEGVEWALGLFNGGSDKPSSTTTCVPGALPTDPPKCTTGLPTNVPTDFKPAIVAHVGFNSGHIKGYSEGDLEGGPLRFAVAASYRLLANDLDKDADDNLLLDHAVVLDAMIKASGLSVTGALVLVKKGQADLATGFYGQASYVLMPKKLLGAVRFAQVPEGAEKKHEILGGFDLFWKGHKAKVTVDAGVIHTTGDPARTDIQIRSQLQLVL